MQIISTCYGRSLVRAKLFRQRLIQFSYEKRIVIKIYYGDDHEYQKRMVNSQESKKVVSCVTICKLVYLLQNTNSKNLSHEQLKFHAYKILLKVEISDLVAMKSSICKYLFKKTVKVF